MADEVGGDPGWLEGILRSTGAFTRLVQAGLGVAGVIGLLAGEWTAHPWLLALSVAIVALAAAWLGVGIYLRRRRPKGAVLPAKPRVASSYLRGLLPFEQDDQLLGRDVDSQRLFGLVRSLEFRCGFVSGEAGAGKTSLLRAKLVPDLASAGWRPIYIARTGIDPGAAIRRALLATVQERNHATESASLDELFARAAEGPPTTPILLIIDQFEEHFVTRRSKSERENFESLLKSIAKWNAAETPIRVLFALRKDFVDDLLDLARFIPELQNNRWRHPLRNFSQDTAREVLRRVASDESLRFSDQLQDLVVADLTMDGTVRPVEFQIVLTRMLDQGIFDVGGYRRVKGAHGIIAHFVTEVIDPPDIDVDDLDRRLAKLVLRLLCNKEFTTRRPIGLTEAEILERVVGQMQSDAQVPVTTAKCQLALRRVLDRLIGDFIVILEDGTRFNLAHDYLASPVRDATAEIETVEERANRVLDQYVEQARIDRSVVLPYRTLRTAARFASPDRLARTEVIALIRRSKRRMVAWVAGGAAFALIFLGLLLPFGERFPVVEQIGMTGSSTLSADGRLLVRHDGDKLVVFQLDKLPFSPLDFSLPVQAFVIGPAGDSMLILGTDHALYEASAANAFRPEKLIDDLGWRDESVRWRSGWAGYSPDGTWHYAVRADGTVFTWPSNSRPQRLFRLSTLSDKWGKEVSASDNAAALDAERDPPLPPEIGMTEDGRWLWMLDGENQLFLLRPGVPPADGKITPITKLTADSFGRGASLIASSDSRWLVLGDNTNLVRAVSLAGPDLKLKAVVDLGAREDSVSGTPTIAISPNGRWLVARRSYEGFFSALLDAATDLERFPAIPFKRTSSDLFVTPIFDRSSRFVAGIGPDRLIYVWPLESPPGTAAKPIYGESIPGGFGSERQQSAFFCASPGVALVGGGDGSVHAIALEPQISPARQIGRLSPGALRFAGGDDDRTVFIYNANELAFGACGEALKQALELGSDIQAISDDDHGNLVIVGAREAVRLERRFYAFGIPVWRMAWPGVRQQ